MADDLLDLTLEMCGKDADHNPRFPLIFYPSLVTQITNVAIKIQECIIMANEEYVGDKRTEMQQKAKAKCKHLNHLIRVCHNRGYISEKQRTRWQKLTTALYWGCARWMESDANRKK